MRGRFFRALQARMEKDPSVFFLTGDMGINLVEPIEEAFPDRYLNVGIAEQDLIGVAAGLSNAGFRPVVYTISNFLVHRCFEQIRNDVILSGNPVVLCGTSAGFDNASLGPTHHIVDDWGSLRSLPGIDIYAPACVEYADGILDRTLDSGRPAYIRMAKGAPSIPGGEADVAYFPGSTGGPLLVSYGSLAGECLKAQVENAELSVLVMNCLESDASVLRHLADHSWTMVVEDHFAHCGLFNLLCQAVMEEGVDCVIRSAAPPAKYDLVVGQSAEVYFRRYDLDAPGILKRVADEPARRGR